MMLDVQGSPWFYGGAIAGPRLGTLDFARALRKTHAKIQSSVPTSAKIQARIPQTRRRHQRRDWKLDSCFCLFAFSRVFFSQSSCIDSISREYYR